MSVSSQGDVLSGVIESLEAALANIQQQRQALDAREAKVQEALNGLREAAGAEVPEPPGKNGDGEVDKPLSISDDRLNKVAKFVVGKGRVRQADIVSELGLNSGTVSVALRRLELDGKVRQGDKERGSRVWEKTQEAPAATVRETRVRPGEGVSEGRVAA